MTSPGSQGVLRALPPAVACDSARIQAGMHATSPVACGFTHIRADRYTNPDRGL